MAYHSVHRLCVTFHYRSDSTSDRHAYTVPWHEHCVDSRVWRDARTGTPLAPGAKQNWASLIDCKYSEKERRHIELVAQQQRIVVPKV